MSLTSLATTAATVAFDAKLAAVYAYVDDQVLTKLVNRGSEVPAAENQSLPWIKTLENGTLDGVFTWHNNNWHTKMPHQIGSVSLFNSASPVDLGWEAATVGLSPSSGFVFRQFTGSGLLIIGSYAFRRHDQPVLQVSS